MTLKLTIKTETLFVHGKSVEAASRCLKSIKQTLQAISGGHDM